MPKSSKQRKLKKKEKTPEEDQNLSVEEMISKAEELMEVLQFEQALSLIQKALEKEPSNTKIMDTYALFLLDLDNFEDAKKLLERSIQLAPNENFDKYMNYGQLLQGKQAIESFKKGVTLMLEEKKKIEEGKITGDLASIRRQISSALCSMAEIYLTDSCFEEEAETESCNLLEQASQIDPSNPEVYQTFASVRISQQKVEEAKEFLNKGYSLWKDAELQDRPSYESRHSCAKLFLELEQPETAAAIWDSLLEEDDNIAEVHYFIGLAFSYFDSESALESLEKSKELLKECPDKALLKQVEDLMEQVQKNPIQKIPETNQEEDQLEDQSEEEMDVE